MKRFTSHPQQAMIRFFWCMEVGKKDGFCWVHSQFSHSSHPPHPYLCSATPTITCSNHQRHFVCNHQAKTPSTLFWEIEWPSNSTESILINKYYLNTSSQMQPSLQLFHVHKVQSAARSQVGMIFMVAFPFQCDHLNHPNFTRPQKTTPLNQCPSILTDVNCIISWLPTAKWKLWTQSKLNQIINNNMIKHQSNAHANKSINHNLCREGNVVQMHHLYTNNSGMQYSWLRWDFFFVLKIYLNSNSFRPDIIFKRYIRT